MRPRSALGWASSRRESGTECVRLARRPGVAGGAILVYAPTGENTAAKPRSHIRSPHPRRNASLLTNFKYIWLEIRNWKLEKTPYAVIIGDKEVEVDKITLESRNDGNVGQITPNELLSKLLDEIKNKK